MFFVLFRDIVVGSFSFKRNKRAVMLQIGRSSVCACLDFLALVSVLRTLGKLFLEVEVLKAQLCTRLGVCLNIVSGAAGAGIV